MKAMATNHFKHISLLILLCVLLSTTAQAQYTLTDDDVVVEDGVILSYSGSETDIVIPHTLDGQVITSIGESAFLFKSLTSIDLSEATQLTTLQTDAFHSNHDLTSVDLSGLTNLTTIGQGAFQASGLSSLDFASLINLKTIGVNAFRGSSDFSSTGFSDLENLTSIGANAFSFTSISSFNLPSPTTAGYIFDGWIDSDDATHANDTEISDFTKGYSAVVESIIEYSITYHADGGSHDNVIATYTVEDEATFSTATKEGYTFHGWFTEPEFTNPITGISGTTGNLNLYAHLSPTPYAINYHADGGSHTNPETYTIYDAVTFTAATKAGYAFDGWYTEPEFINLISEIEAGSMEEVSVYAKYDIITYDITYHADGASHDNILSTYTVEDEETFSVAAKDGYTFHGWFTEPEFTNPITEISGTTGDLNLYAKLSPISYVINYHLDGGSHTNPETYTINDAVTFTTATKAGYDFDGWYTEAEFTNPISEIEAGSMEDIALYAKFEISTYSITYHAYGGTHDNPDTYTINEAVPFSEAIKDGKIFDGWYADPNFRHKITELPIGSYGNVNLYADYIYVLTDADVEVVDGVIISYSSSENNILIPNMLDGQTITGIGESAFDYVGLTKLDLSQLTGLTSIGEAAFSYNNISSVIFGELTQLKSIGSAAFDSNELAEVDLRSLTQLMEIGEYAFSYNQIVDVDLSGLSYLTTIGDHAFFDNEIENFVLPSPDASLIGEWRDADGMAYASGHTVPVDNQYRFTNDSPYTLTSDDVVVELGEILSVQLKINYPNIIIPNQLDEQEITAIASEVFYGSQLSSIDLSQMSNLEVIGEGAFSYNQLTTLDLSGLSNLTIIDYHAFTGNQLSTVVFTGLSNLEVIGEVAFAYNQIEAVSFLGLTNLTTIGNYAFVNNQLNDADVTSLTRLTTIGQGAFKYNNVDNFELPTVGLSGVWTNEDEQTFNFEQEVSVNGGYYFTSHEPYTLTDDDVVVEDGMIISVSMNMSYSNIIIPTPLDGQEIVAIGPNTFEYLRLNSVDISGLTGLTSIGESAFRSNRLMAIDLSQTPNLMSIGWSAFNENSIESLDLGGMNQLKTIEAYAFSNNEIASLDLSGLGQLETIGSYAFRNNRMTSADFSDLTHLTNVDAYAFANNELASIVWPDSEKLSQIGAYAFFQNEISSIDLSSLIGLRAIEIYAFSYNALTTVDLSGLAQLETIGDRAFFNNIIEAVDFSGCSSLISIGKSAFRNNLLTALDLSSLTSLKIIDDGAFHDNNLSALTLSGMTNLSTLGTHAFSSNSLGSVDLSDLSHLTTIEHSVFIDNELTSFALPITSIEGYNYNGWLGGTHHAPGEVVTYLSQGYTAVLESLVDYSIVYHANGGTHDNQVLYNVEDEMSFLAATKLGYTFEGWYEDQAFTNQIDGVEAGMTGDLELFANFVAIPFNLTYHVEGGTHENPLSYTIEDEVTFSAATKAGYTFEGWYSDAAYTVEIERVEEGTMEDIELYAQFAPITYSLTYHVGEAAHDNPATYTVEDELTFTAAAKDGYTFEGWFTDEALTNEITGITSGSTGDLDLFVKFSPTLYAITYQTDEGSHDNPDTYTIEDELTFTAATKDGYTFEGWFTDEALTNEVTGIASGSTGDLDLFVKFSLTVYSITYQTDGGSHDNPDSYTIEDALTLEPATKDGFEFEGWFTDEDLTDEIVEIKAGSTGDMELYAKFSEIILGFQDLAHSSIVLYPNPVVSSFSIDTEVDQIVVLSIDGQLVQSFIGNQTHYDVSHLKPGRYIVQLIDSGQSIGMKKIIINSNGR